MLSTLLKSRIHRAAVTHCGLNDEGSCAVDEALPGASSFCENGQIHIWNIDNACCL